MVSTILLFSVVLAVTSDGHRLNQTFLKSYDSIAILKAAPSRESRTDPQLTYQFLTRGDVAMSTDAKNKNVVLTSSRHFGDSGFVDRTLAVQQGLRNLGENLVSRGAIENYCDASDDAVVEVTVRCLKGTLVLPNQTPTVISHKNGEGRSSVTFSGAQSDVKSSLKKLVHSATGKDTHRIAADDTLYVSTGKTQPKEPAPGPNDEVCSILFVLVPALSYADPQLTYQSLTRGDVAMSTDAENKNVVLTSSRHFGDSGFVDRTLAVQQGLRNLGENLVSRGAIENYCDASDDAVVEVTVRCLKGTLVLPNQTPTVISHKNGEGRSSVTFSGAQSDVKSSLKKLVHSATGKETHRIAADDTLYVSTGKTQPKEPAPGPNDEVCSILFVLVPALSYVKGLKTETTNKSFLN